jgi:hypothetical protein
MLKGRKPAQAKATLSASTSTSLSGCAVTASMAKKAHAIPASVAAIPSMLSSRLNAFVIPTSQTTPIGTAIQSFLTSSTVSPCVSTIAVAPSCAASFASGGNEKASSTSPVTNRSAAARMIATSSELAPIAPKPIAAPSPATIPAKTPIPPSNGVSRRCQRSRVGLATSTRASGERSAAQIAVAAAGRATAETSEITTQLPETVSGDAARSR